MRYFSWDEVFETGLPEIDDQHHRLVDLIDHFGALLAEPQSLRSRKIDAAFDELAEFARYHFREEERFMASAAIDRRQLGEHVRQHKAFLDQVTRFRAALASGEGGDATGVFKFLTSWLAFHTLGDDQMAIRQARAIRDGKTPEEAYLAEAAHRDVATQPLLGALNSLFQHIVEQNRELLVLNKNLEEKVKERTKELEEANRKLEEMALSDVLTGLPNRRHAMARLAEEWSRSTESCAPLACMMIDADGFKQMNDTCGHEAGDEVLRKLARALRDKARPSDIVCRLGGDEFLILCPDTSLESALKLADEARHAISALRVLAGGGVWRGSVSVGVAARTPDMLTPTDLIRAADEGVYLSKQNGRNRVGYAGEPRRILASMFPHDTLRPRSESIRPTPTLRPSIM